MAQYTFSIIIPVFNNWELTKNCLSSLREHTGRDDYEVVVVDNASVDDTRTELEPFGKNLFPNAFTAIRNAENINFGPACNLGANRADAELLFFLNNDTLVTPGWYEPLHKALEATPSLGAVGPLLLYEDRRVQHLGVAYSSAGLSHLYSEFPADHPVVGRERRLQAITGAAMLLAKDTFLAAGGFHEGYRNGFEDVELCVRIRESGKHLSCATSSAIFHLESKSEGRHANKDHNSLLLAKRCGNALYPDLHLHGARDGFKVVVNEAMEQSLLLADWDDQELRAQTAGKSLDLLYVAVKQNPYWLWGNETLGNALEAAGCYPEAALFYYQITLFYPGLKYYQKLLRLAALANMTSLHDEAVKQVGILTRLQVDRQQSLDKVRSIIKKAEILNDNLLLTLYQDKLAAMTGPPL